MDIFVIKLYVFIIINIELVNILCTVSRSLMLLSLKKFLEPISISYVSCTLLLISPLEQQ